MEKEKIIEILNHFYCENYKNIFAAILVYEKDLDIDKLEEDYLEDIYNKYMDSDITGLLNEDLKDLIEEEE